MYAGTLIPSVDLRFMADFCSHQGAYDELSRVYSASGEIKAKVRPKEGANQRTDYVYLRVAKDTYWVDSSF